MRLRRWVVVLGVGLVWWSCIFLSSVVLEVVVSVLTETLL